MTLEQPASIGLIGLGMMGQGIGSNLLRRGFPLTVAAHRSRTGADRLAGEGAAVVDGPHAVAAASDVVILCVPGSPQVEAVMLGPDGVLAGARSGPVGPGLIVIDCSTSEPGSTERIAAAVAAAGGRFADAPLARTPVEAEAGKLNTMVGADDDTMAAIRPVLAAFCENIFHVGPVGAGHKMKLVNNFLAMGQATLIAEAFTACSAVGVPLEKLFEVISAGGANSGIFRMVAGAAKDGDLDGMRFGIANAAKDLGYYTRMTDAVPLTGNLGHAVRHALVEARNLGFADALVGHLIAAQARINGRAAPGAP